MQTTQTKTSAKTGENPGDGSPERPVRLIKRYANRKLYDTSDSHYITLQQIAELVREGEDVRIIDNTTKEDLTKVTLAQIIYEEEKKQSEGGSRSSVGMLRNLIQQSGERLMTSLREGPMGKLIPRRGEVSEAEATEAHAKAQRKAEEKARAEAEEAARRAQEKKAQEEAAKEKRFSVFASSKEAFEELQRLADDQLRSLLGHAIGRVQTLQKEVAGLQGRIEELEQRLVSLSRREAEEAREAGETGDAGEAGEPAEETAEASSSEDI